MKKSITFFVLSLFCISVFGQTEKCLTSIKKNQALQNPTIAKKVKEIELSLKTG